VSKDLVPRKNEDNLPESLSLTSSTPPLIPEEQESLYRDVLEALESQAIPYAVSGAFALKEHTGICRQTKDLDIFLSAENLSAALTHLQKRGFECEIADPVWLAKAHQGDFFVDLITGMSNATISVDSSWIDRAKPAEIVGVSTRILAPEELLASKLFVLRRERFDGADIAHIIFATKGRLDWDRLLKLAGEHWEILLWALVLYRYVYPGQSDYVPGTLWQDLLSRFFNLVAEPDHKAKFRGSLVDDNMFAIDVNDWGLPDLLSEYRDRRLAAIRKAARAT
jgi:hypothetical protein